MSFGNLLSLVGFCVAGFGSSLGMWGIFMQGNSYFPFEPTFPNFVENLYRLLKTIITKGMSTGTKQIAYDIKLCGARKEDRVTSVKGFYAVFLGFLFQLVGGLIALIGSLFSSGHG